MSLPVTVHGLTQETTFEAVIQQALTIASANQRTLLSSEIEGAQFDIIVKQPNGLLRKVDKKSKLGMAIHDDQLTEVLVHRYLEVGF